MISKKYEQLKEFLAGQTFQNGSYARHTSTTPVNDLDVFYILPESVRKLVVEARIKPEELTIENILEDLAAALQKEYKNEARVIVQPHSVGIFFGEKDEFSIDVVPAQPALNGLYWVPETALHSISSRRALYESKTLSEIRWIKSDPQGYILQATDLDDATNGTFRKAAKFVKKWKQACKKTNSDFPLKSFHVEIVVTEAFKEKRQLSCIEAIHQFYKTLPNILLHPQYPDRADRSRFIDAYIDKLSDVERDIINKEHERAIKLIDLTISTNSEAQVLRSIEELLRLGPKSATERPQTVTPHRESPAYSRPYRY
jgi:hypothetical protein